MNIKDEDKNKLSPERVAVLLRSIGGSSRLVGFKYIVFIVWYIFQNPDEHFSVTKAAYPAAAKRYDVSPASVEHAIRTVMASCWDRYDHTDIDRVAGIQLERMPTNTEFIIMLVDHLRYCSYE